MDNVASMLPAVFALLVPIVGAIGLFTFLAVSSWASEKRREREAFFRAEIYKKLAEQGGTASEELLRLVREERESQARRAREGKMLGGLIVTAVGLGLSAFMWVLARGLPGPGNEGKEGVWAVGLLPLFIGLAIVIHTWTSSRSSKKSESGNPKA